MKTFLVLLAALPAFVSAAEPAETEPPATSMPGQAYACGYVEGGRDGVVTVMVEPAGTDVRCKIDVRGEVAALLKVEVTFAPTEPRP